MESRYGRYDFDSCSDVEEEHEAEPSLGWQNEGPHGHHWTGRDDLELDTAATSPIMTMSSDYRNYGIPPNGYMG